MLLEAGVPHDQKATDGKKPIEMVRTSVCLCAPLQLFAAPCSPMQAAALRNPMQPGAQQQARVCHLVITPTTPLPGAQQQGHDQACVSPPYHPYQVRNNKGTTKLLKQWAARGRQCYQLKGGRMECELMKKVEKPKKEL